MQEGPHGFADFARPIFIAYIDFDQVSSAARESKNPARDLPIGILGSLAICTAIYILVAGVLTGLVKYTSLDAPAPIAMGIGITGIQLACELLGAFPSRQQICVTLRKVERKSRRLKGKGGFGSAPPRTGLRVRRGGVSRHRMRALLL